MKSGIILSFFVVPVMFANLLSAASDGRIVGGNVVAYEDVKKSYPWMVAIYSGDTYFCGGTLVQNDVVLTAAHCLKEMYLPDGVVKGWRTDVYKKELNVFMPSKGQVRSGQSQPGAVINVNEKELKRTVTRYMIHPDYEKVNRFSHDIALLLLDSPYNKIEHMDIGAYKNYKKARVIGWGATSYSSGSSPELNVASDVPVDGVCGDFLCAGGSGMDSCKGDSGGPLFVNTLDGTGSTHFVQIGIVSHGASKNDMCVGDGRYTNVGNYIGWIHAETYNIRR